jgi:hypothetical protein
MKEETCAIHWIQYNNSSDWNDDQCLQMSSFDQGTNEA